jgi:hypothetical protein
MAEISKLRVSGIFIPEEAQAVSRSAAMRFKWCNRMLGIIEKVF